MQGSGKISAARISVLLELAYERFQSMLYDEVAELRSLDRSRLHGLSIKTATLLNVATSYLFDVERARDFHDTLLVNEYRQAAYLGKWLIRLRPINDTNDDGRFLLANEKFTLAVMMSLVRLPASLLSETLYAHLLYSLRYRVLDEGALIAVLMALKRPADPASH